MHDGRGFTMKLSPVRWLWREREGGGQTLGFHITIWSKSQMWRLTYFLLWAGDFSPASPSSSAWTCRSWSPQRYQACRTWLDIWEIAMRHRSNSDLEPHLAQNAQVNEMWRRTRHVTQVHLGFSQTVKRWARVSVEGRCLTPSTERNTYT